MKREPFSYECYWESTQNKLVLHSYVVTTKSSSKRNALLLSTVQPILDVTKDDEKKNLRCINCTNFTKGGTAVMDHRIATDTCKAKSNY